MHLSWRREWRYAKFLLTGVEVCLLDKKEKVKSCRNLIFDYVLALSVLLGNQIFVDKISLLFPHKY